MEVSSVWEIKGIVSVKFDGIFRWNQMSVAEAHSSLIRARQGDAK